MYGKKWPILYSNLLFRVGSCFLDIQYFSIPYFCCLDCLHGLVVRGLAFKSGYEVCILLAILQILSQLHRLQQLGLRAGFCIVGLYRQFSTHIIHSKGQISFNNNIKFSLRNKNLKKRYNFHNFHNMHILTVKPSPPPPYFLWVQEKTNIQRKYIYMYIYIYLELTTWFIYWMVAHMAMRTYRVNEAFRFFKDISLQMLSNSIIFFKSTSPI